MSSWSLKRRASLPYDEWPDRYYFGKERRLVDAAEADENDPDVVEVHRLFAELPGVPTHRDVTALEWLRDIVGGGSQSPIAQYIVTLLPPPLFLPLLSDGSKPSEHV